MQEHCGVGNRNGGLFDNRLTDWISHALWATRKQEFRMRHVAPWLPIRQKPSPSLQV